MSVRVFGDIVTPDAVLQSSSIVVDTDTGLILDIENGRNAQVDWDFDGCLIVPGFIDVHVHGGGGGDFMDGSEASVRTALHTHARHGTTTLLATTLTASNSDINQAIKAIKTVMDSPLDSEAHIHGIHLEGPYICAAKRGAQPLAPIRKPDTAELAEWIETSGGAIKMITMAPEMGDDCSADFIKFAHDNGIVVSIGHTNATYDQAKLAIDHGARHVTHLFNAMPTLHHREPGVIGAVLNDDSVTIELIADGVHIHPAVLKIAINAKGIDRVILITDAISGASMPDGDYKLGGQDVIVAHGTAKFSDGTLAGSVLTMNHAFANIQRFASVSAIAAARMSSLNAATQLGINDAAGSIQPGKRADLAILSPKTSDCLATMSDGKWIWRQ